MFSREMYKQYKRVAFFTWKLLRCLKVIDISRNGVLSITSTVSLADFSLIILPLNKQCTEEHTNITEELDFVPTLSSFTVQ